MTTSHDTSLFLEIEQGEVDHSAYRNQLLFAYRSCAGERRKKEIVSDMFGSMLNNQEARIEMGERLIIKFTAHTEGFLLGASDCKWYMDQISCDLNDLSRSTFTFLTRKIPQLNVCAATGFSPIDYLTVTDGKQKEPLPLIFVNIIPRQDHAFLIIGYHNGNSTEWMKKFLQDCSSANQIQIEEIISNILIKRCETWAMSPQMYDAFEVDERLDLLREFHRDMHNLDQDLYTHINLFRSKKDKII